MTNSTRPIYPAEFADHLERLTAKAAKGLRQLKTRDEAYSLALRDLGALASLLYDYLDVQARAVGEDGERGAKLRYAGLKKKVLALDDELTERHKIPKKGRDSFKA
jgi:hypothetical protein